MTERLSRERLAEIRNNECCGGIKKDCTIWDDCDDCRMDTFHALLGHIAALEAENDRLHDLACADWFRCPVPQLTEAHDALKAEVERLRHDAEQWRKHEYGVARACEQGMADLARLAALEAEVWGE